MQVGKRITDLRTAQGLSTNRLAHMAGISQSYLRDVEHGVKNPTVETLSFICDALHISLQGFFTEKDSAIDPLLSDVIASLTPSEQQALAAFLHAIRRES